MKSDVYNHAPMTVQCFSKTKDSLKKAEKDLESSQRKTLDEFWR